jgi:arabinofuranan 3-O-arabinosyltransferase
VTRAPRLPRRTLVVVSAALTALCLAQQPGKTPHETKPDLVADPAGWLDRALGLWDALGAFGQLQNQAVGYLVPMGPFYLAGDAAGVPMWIVQRLWLAALLVLALWGVARLAAELRIGPPAGWVLAGTTYALSPMVLGHVGFTSVIVLPAALAPWTVLPLARGWRTGAARRPAALSGLAVLGMGGVNAASTVLALPLPALYLLTRPRSPLRRRLVLWWALAVALACAWWVGALALQGRYGLRFLDYTESADVTTSTAAATEALRGTGQWLWYLALGDPWVRSGWDLSFVPGAVVATGALAAAGLAGLCARALPERRFLVTSLAAGVVLVSAGYSGPLGGIADGAVRDLLADPFAALRNVHKAEPLIRLPLALGLAALTGPVVAFARRPGMPRRMAAAAAGACAVAALVGAAWPALDGRLMTHGAYETVPAHWKQTADFLAARAPRSTALLVPAASFGEYTWGRTLDEPLQPLARSPWAVRNLIPLGGLESTRLLDEIESRIVTGKSSRGMPALLRRSGVRYVVARNDLDWRRTASPRPLDVHDALVAAGLRRVAAFGPRVATRGSSAFARAEARLPAVEIFDTGGAAPPVAVYPQAGARVVDGGPESLPALADLPLLGGRAAVLAADLPGGAVPPQARWLVTDAFQRRATDFGLVHDGRSYVLADGERPAGGGPVRQYAGLTLAGRQTVAVTRGAARVSASSYGSWLVHLPELAPAGAFDRAPSTAWVAGDVDGSAGEWVEVAPGRTVVASGGTVRLLQDTPARPRILRLAVTTDRGTRMTDLSPTEDPQGVRVAPGPTRRIRVTIAAVRGERDGGPGPGLREVDIAGVRVARDLRPAQDARLMAAARRADDLPSFVFSRAASDPEDILRRDEEPLLRRELTLPRAARLRITGTATPRPGPVLDRLLTRTRGVRARASSTFAALPRWRAGNAVDGSRRTAWLAGLPAPAPARRSSAPGLRAVAGGAALERVTPVPATVDPRPELVLRWRRRHRLGAVRVLPPPGEAVAPAAIRISAPSGVREVAVAPGRLVRFPPLRTDRLRVTFVRPRGAGRSRPLGVAELDFPALRGERTVGLPPPAPLLGRCGQGPDVLLDERRLPTRLVAATAGRAVALEAVRFKLCRRDAAVRLEAGPHRIRGVGGSPFRISDLTLSPVARRPSPPATPRTIAVTRWEAGRRAVRVGPGTGAYLAMRQNMNRGWRAELDGRRLRPVRLDGWQQGFVVPAGSGGTIEMTFAPETAYRAVLLAGAAFLVILVLLAVVPARARRKPPRAGALPPPDRPPAPEDAEPRIPVLAGGAIDPPIDRRATLAVLVGTAVVVALVSWPAVLALPLLAAIAVVRRSLLAPIAAGAMLAATILAATATDRAPTEHAGAFGGPAQVLAALALAAVCLAAFAPVRRRLGAAALWTPITGGEPAPRPDAAGAPAAPAPPAGPATSGANGRAGPGFFDLARLWRREQQDPAALYRVLAEQVADTLERRHGPLAGQRIADLGCGPGWYTAALRARGAEVLPIDASEDELALAGRPPEGAIVADAMDLPLADASLDGVLCSNMLEHTPDARRVLAEIERVLRPGGWAYVSWTNWFSPWGGHDMTPYHLLGRRLGTAAYRRRHGGRLPKNHYGTTLFPVHVGATLRFVRRRPGLVLERAEPRYWPRLRAILAVPLVREVLTWNCVMHLRRRA